MTGLRTYWRKSGGLAAILLAFALLLAPVAEAFACGGEGLAAAQQVVTDMGSAPSAMADVASIDHGTGAPGLADDLGLCQHGHCHHAAPYLAPLTTELADHPAASPPTVKLQNQHARSRAPSRLERPPRV